MRLEAGFYWFTRRPILSALVCFLIAYFFYGIGGNGDYFRISQNPFITDSNTPFFQDAILLPLAAYLLSLNRSINLFYLFCFFAILIAFLLSTLLPRKRFGEESATILLIILAVHPLSVILFNFLGIPDPFTLILSIILAFTSSPALLFLSAAFGVVNHPQMVVIVPLLGILRLSASFLDFSKKQLLYMLIGAIIGFFIVRFFLFYNQITISPSRLDIMINPGIPAWMKLKAGEFPLNVLSLYHGLWFIVISGLFLGYKYDSRYYIVFTFIQLLAASITFFTIDTTRVFGLLTLPALLHFCAYTLKVVRYSNHEYILLRRVWLIILLLSLFVPKFYAWEGKIIFPESQLIW